MANFLSTFLPWPLNQRALKATLDAHSLTPIDIPQEGSAGPTFDLLELITNTTVHQRVDHSSRIIDWLEIEKALRGMIREDYVVREVSIREVNGISASKSPHKEHQSLFEFGRSLSTKHPISEGGWPHSSKDDFIANIETAWQTKTKEQNFKYSNWNKQLLWQNKDGSHHFALAYYQAIKQNLDYKVTGNIKHLSLDAEAAQRLLKLVDIYVVRESPTLTKALNVLSDINITAQTASLPCCQVPLSLILIPTENPKSKIIRNWLDNQAAQKASINILKLLYQEA